MARAAALAMPTGNGSNPAIRSLINNRLVEMTREREELLHALTVLDGPTEVRQSIAAPKANSHRRTISRAGRNKIAAAQRARWAMKKAQLAKVAAKEAKKPAKAMTAAG